MGFDADTTAARNLIDKWFWDMEAAIRGVKYLNDADAEELLRQISEYDPT